MKRNKMSYRNKKHGNLYEVITICTDCNNDRRNEKAIIYTKKQSWFTKFRAVIIRLLLPNDVYVRNTDEFCEKFDEVS